MGQIHFAKFLLVFRYCFEAIVCRFRYGVTSFYFAPAPRKRPALYRDWIVMLICRPFFPIVVQHWHAAGLGDWLHSDATRLERWVTERLLGRASLGISLAVANLRDPLWLKTREVAVIPNGVADPFPAFTTDILPRRQARLSARQRLLEQKSLTETARQNDGADVATFQLLYLAHCFPEKGLFETIDGVVLAEAALRADNHPLHLHLTIAGDFASESERQAFYNRIAQPEISRLVEYAGFVSGGRKLALLRDSDCLCFPTYYHLESFGVVVIEAMAAGLPIIATKWRALPEILPFNYPGFVPVRDAAAIARCIPRLFTFDGVVLRDVFLERFTEEVHLNALGNALLHLDEQR
jgi:glycosyltransferase involved in cell wall biosynthesis